VTRCPLGNVGEVDSLQRSEATIERIFVLIVRNLQNTIFDAKGIAEIFAKGATANRNLTCCVLLAL